MAGAQGGLQPTLTAMREARDKSLRHPVPVRRLAVKLLALAPPAVGSRHRRGRAGLVDKDQSGKVEARLSLPPQSPRQSNVRPVLFGRVYRFF